MASMPGAIFGLHVFQRQPVPSCTARGHLAASDGLQIKIKVQTHGSMPWGGVDPIVASGRSSTPCNILSAGRSISLMRPR